MASEQHTSGTARFMQTRVSGVPEASGLAALGGDEFFLVDDERGIFHYAAEGRAQRLDAGGELVDLEGIALSPDGRHLRVLSECDGRVWVCTDGNGLLHEVELIRP